jgi:hypothetical protein
MDFIEKWYKDYMDEFRSHCHERVLECVDEGNSVTEYDYEHLCGLCEGFNSYDRHLLYPLMDRALLIKTARYCLLNSSPDQRVPAVTYDASMLTIIVPLLLDQLESTLVEDADHD